MADIQTLVDQLQLEFQDFDIQIILALNEITLEVPKEHLLTICKTLRDHQAFKFEMLMDVCGVDYLEYGIAEWSTEETTETGFSRGVEKQLVERINSWDKPRFAVAYHFLSLTHNHRLRLRVFTEGEPPHIDSVHGLWNSANWSEREVFDLFGIIFDGHPDLRRILTDYGFSGHPFRKDFPLIGNVEPRYDYTAGKIVYEPVSIQPRILVPKVIRTDTSHSMPQATPPNQEKSNA